MFLEVIHMQNNKIWKWVLKWFYSQFLFMFLCSDLICGVFPALSCCLLHLWSHPEGWCRTESVPLHVGDTPYVHLANTSTVYSIYCTVYYIKPCLFVSRPQRMARRSRGGEPGGSEGPAQPTKQTLIQFCDSQCVLCVGFWAHLANKLHGHRAASDASSTVKETRHHGGLVIRWCDVLCKSCT